MSLMSNKLTLFFIIYGSLSLFIGMPILSSICRYQNLLSNINKDSCSGWNTVFNRMLLMLLDALCYGLVQEYSSPLLELWFFHWSV
ncbi:hypothetical protein HA402_016195 [Bradysia odoriphaga]|nr:hypothetical protein HA402_016195 [Bradysia odoriphaga]